MEQANSKKLTMLQLPRTPFDKLPAIGGECGIGISKNQHHTHSQTSGNDTNLIGAQVAGKSVQMQVGGDLNITTLQDTSEYKSKQQSGGFNISVCVPPICYGQTVSGSVNYAQTKINHDYQSATGQSGIAAGEGGFDITVNGNTALNGAAITSEASADQNNLRTGSLSYTDLANHQKTQASSVSVSAGTSGNAYLQMAQNALANLAGSAALPKDMDESSQTRSVISPANITLTQDTNGISQANATELTNRDASTANQGLTNTLKLQDIANMEQDMKQAQQNAQAANLVGAVLTNVIGDVAQDFNKQAQLAENARAQAAGEIPKEVSTWADGSVEKMLLHGLAGLIQAKIAGGDLSIGLAAGAMNEALIPVMAEFLAQQGVQEWVQDANANTVKNPNYAGLMQLGSTLAGAALGAVAGKTQNASLAANVAKNATENNRLLHQSEYDRAKKLSHNKAALDKLSSIEGRTITQEELEGRILAETLKNSDSLVASENPTHDYNLRSVIGCNNLNCSGIQGQVEGYYNNTQNLDVARNNFNSTSLADKYLNNGLTDAQYRQKNITYERTGKFAVAATACVLGGRSACKYGAQGAATAAGFNYALSKPVTTTDVVIGAYTGNLGKYYESKLVEWSGGINNVVVKGVAKTPGFPTGQVTKGVVGDTNSFDPILDPKTNPYWGLKNIKDKIFSPNPTPLFPNLKR